jgi:short-subunit dehydrogenase
VSGTRLDGARALLTGASSGIGEALAGELTSRGAQVIMVARRADTLHLLAERLTASGRGRARSVPADLAVPGSGPEVVRAAVDSLGGLDIVINNAGVGLVAGQAELGDDEAARALFELHYWTPLAIVRAALPALGASDRPTVVNVTSTVQAVPIPLLGFYAASKAALARATQALRSELTPAGIRVVEVVPGATDTAARDVDLLPWHSRPPRMLPPASPESVARAVIRTLEGGGDRTVYPRSSLLPLEIPAIGRLVAGIAAGHLDLDRPPSRTRSREPACHRPGRVRAR